MRKIIFLLALFILMGCASPTSPTAFDPNLYAVQQRMTAQSAQEQANLYSMMATGTAQAPIIAITQAAAAQQMESTGTAQAMLYQQQSWTVTAQSVQSTETAAMTATAMAWTPTPNATMTLVFAKVDADINQLQLEKERAEIRNNFYAILPGLVFALVAGGLILLMIWVSRRERYKPAQVDERGNLLPILDAVEGIWTDVDTMPNYRGDSSDSLKSMFREWLRKKLELQPQLPAITAERQAEVKKRDQAIDLATRANLPKRSWKEFTNPDTTALPSPQEDELIPVDYPLPEWNEWMQKWKPGHLALGVNEKGLLQADPEFSAHFLFAGTTVSGKTRSGVRVVVTCALASGWQVIIAGKELDYKVFANHPNAYLVPFSLLSDPTRATDLLRSVYQEIERRDRMMSKANYSLWRETGKSRTMIVMDEFSNLADALEDIGKARRDELWRWARMDTAEARKYGIHMVYALQDPTAQSIDLRIRRNTTPVMFRVKDAASSRTLLNVGGAEMLSVRHFLTSIIHVERGVAFAPSDVEIMQFLNGHPVQKAEEDDWIDGVVRDVPESLPGRTSAAIPPPAPQTLKDFLGSLNELEAKVLDLHIGGSSKSEIARQVYGQPAGSAFYKVSELIRRYEAFSPTTTPTTTTNPPKMAPAAA